MLPLMMRTITVAAVALALAACSSDDTTTTSTTATTAPASASSTTAESSPAPTEELRPAAEVEAERMPTFEYGEPFEHAGVTAIVGSPSQVTRDDGMPAWRATLRVENRGDADTEASYYVLVRCADGETGSYYAESTFDAMAYVPPMAFLEGDLVVGPPEGECEAPRLFFRVNGGVTEAGEPDGVLGPLLP
jgi:hypothetical protein